MTKEDRAAIEAPYVRAALSAGFREAWAAVRDHGAQIGLAVRFADGVRRAVQDDIDQIPSEMVAKLIAWGAEHGHPIQ